MARKTKFTIASIESLPPNHTLYDDANKGLGLLARRQRSEAITYSIEYRDGQGGTRWYKIGRHGVPWTPEMARVEAKRLKADIDRGIYPHTTREEARQAITVRELCEQYMAAAQTGRSTALLRRGRVKKASTLATDGSRISSHIVPLLGDKIVAEVKGQDIDRWLNQVAEGKTRQRVKLDRPHAFSNVRGGKGTATRTLSLLSAIMSYAVRQGHRPDNPCRGVQGFEEKQRTRRLSDHEFGCLGRALDAAFDKKMVWLPAIEATRFIALTGWRLGEVLNLQWTDVDVPKRTAILGDTKTGRSVRPLSTLALAIIDRQQKIGSSPYVFSSAKGTPMSGFRSMWLRILALADIPAEIVPHTLRHSFASVAADLNFSEPTIGALIGHKGQTITSRYIHSADTVLLAASDQVSVRISELLGTFDRSQA